MLNAFKCKNIHLTRQGTHIQYVSLYFNGCIVDRVVYNHFIRFLQLCVIHHLVYCVSCELLLSLTEFLRGITEGNQEHVELFSDTE